jgi:hypothetical protein
VKFARPVEAIKIDSFSITIPHSGRITVRTLSAPDFLIAYRVFSFSLVNT